MPATALTPTRIVAAGSTLSETATDAVNGNSVRNVAGLVLAFRNTDATSRSVTVTTSATVAGYAVADQVIAVPAGATRYVGNLSAAAFGDVVTFTSESALVMVTAYQAS